MVGDIVVAAGTIAYSGPFTPAFRQLLQQEWNTLLQQFGVPHTTDVNLIDTLQVGCLNAFQTLWHQLKHMHLHFLRAVPIPFRSSTTGDYRNRRAAQYTTDEPDNFACAGATESAGMESGRPSQ